MCADCTDTEVPFGTQWKGQLATKTRLKESDPALWPWISRPGNVVCGPQISILKVRRGIPGCYREGMAVAAEYGIIIIAGLPR